MFLQLFKCQRVFNHHLGRRHRIHIRCRRGKFVLLTFFGIATVRVKLSALLKLFSLIPHYDYIDRILVSGSIHAVLRSRWL